MDGIHVGLDLFYNSLQTGIFAIYFILLSLSPKILVAPDAANLPVDTLVVRDLDNVVMAIHTIKTAVDTLIKFIR